ncbi:MAG: hypothetical protein QOD12_1809 [Verrucomicrobiota bacterium]|jgi:predicted O-methyltransferase YrrM
MPHGKESFALEGKVSIANMNQPIPLTPPQIEFIVQGSASDLDLGPKWKVFTKTLLDPLCWWASRRRLSALDMDQIVRTPLGVLNEPIGWGWYKWLKLQQVAPEIERLIEHLKELRPRRIVEIGSAYGGSFLIWATLASEQVVSIDLPQNISFFTARQKMWHYLLRRHEGKRFAMIAADSHREATVETVRRILEGGQCDFLFVDGDHTSRGVEQDFVHYRSLVRPGGLIAFHDILPHRDRADSEVDLFWNKVREHEKSGEIVADPDQGWGGIGLVWQ